eukprot:scaffold97527_cov79-Phaeocystis_antarctica.AAC.3
MSGSVSARSTSFRAPRAPHMGTKSLTPPSGNPQTSATRRLPSLPTAEQLARSGPLAVIRMRSATARFDP